MNPTLVKVLRWVLFLPAAIAAAFVAQVFIALTQIFLAQWVVELNIKVFMGAAFVAVGAGVAPTHRAWPAVTLLSMQVIAASCGVALVWKDDVPDKWWQLVLLLAVVFGSAVGFMQARANTPKADDRQLTQEF